MIILIDRTNHHLFQPLLYQVATSVLTPSQIATPIRGILRKQKNATVILGEVTGVDKDQKRVFVNDADRLNVPISYDYLILATGSTHSYFGHNEFEQFAPGLKSLADAEAARNKILQAFELAEAEDDPARHRDLLTFILVGAGPTGVEMAGAAVEIDEDAGSRRVPRSHRADGGRLRVGVDAQQSGGCCAKQEMPPRVRAVFATVFPDLLHLRSLVVECEV